MRIDVLTLFPEFFTSPLAASLLGKALKSERATVHCTNFRDYTTDKHRSVDDVPYGGGVGMVLKPEPLFAAVEACLLYTSPSPRDLSTSRMPSSA